MHFAHHLAWFCWDLSGVEVLMKNMLNGVKLSVANKSLFSIHSRREAGLPSSRTYRMKNTNSIKKVKLIIIGKTGTYFGSSDSDIFATC